MIRLRITLKKHLSNLSSLIIILIITIVMTVLFYNADFDSTVVYIPIGFFVVINIPVIVIHLNYWIEDRNKLVQIDPDNQIINVTKGNKELTYTFNDIKCVILVSQLSNKFGQTSRKVPWADYFYYMIDFKNGERLILTSLLLRQKDFTLTVHHHRFLLIQIIDNFNYDSHIDTEIKISKQLDLSEVDKFKGIYKDYSQRELQDIINNKKRYEGAAIKAAKELLKR